MNKLSEAIEQAKQDCLTFGNGEIKINNNIMVYAEWTDFEEDEDFGVVEIEIRENGKIKFLYQLEETKTEY